MRRRSSSQIAGSLCLAAVFSIASASLCRAQDGGAETPAQNYDQSGNPAGTQAPDQSYPPQTMPAQPVEPDQPPDSQPENQPESKPLQGGLTETQILKPEHKKKQKMLQGQTDQEGGALQGGAQDSGGQPLTGGLEGNGFGGPLQAGVAQPVPFGQPLQGNASGNPALQGNADQDGADQELLVEWDRWRNNLQRAIQNNVIALINVHNNVNFYFDQRQNMMVSRYPLGISAWYSVDVLPTKKIINIRITQSSGVQPYDQAVYQAIANLDGQGLLRYPKGSKRQIVNQQASIGTATSNQYQNFQFGDVEHQNYRR